MNLNKTKTAALSLLLSAGAAMADAPTADSLITSQQTTILGIFGSLAVMAVAIVGVKAGLRALGFVGNKVTAAAGGKTVK